MIGNLLGRTIMVNDSYKDIPFRIVAKILMEIDANEGLFGCWRLCLGVWFIHILWIITITHFFLLTITFMDTLLHIVGYPYNKNLDKERSTVGLICT